MTNTITLPSMEEDDREALTWRGPSMCASANCVQVAVSDDSVLVRNSKDTDGVLLRFTHAEWDAFCRAVALGEFSALREAPRA